MALLLRAREDDGSQVWPLLAGAGLGLAAGSELAALLPAAVIGLWGVAVIRRHRGRGAGLLLAGTLALGGLWYLRNSIVAGNPIYPVPSWSGATRCSAAGRTSSPSDPRHS